MTCTRSVVSELGELLLDFQNREPSAIETFPRVVLRYFRGPLRRMAWDLPEDIHPEIISQMHLQILTSGAQFDPANITAQSFLLGHLRTAVKQVRAQYCPPGRQTRFQKRKGARNESPNQFHDVSLTELEEEDQVRDDRSAAIIFAQCDAKVILGKAPAHVATGLRRILGEGETLGKVAVELGLSRFKLSRDIASFARKLHKAA